LGDEKINLIHRDKGDAGDSSKSVDIDLRHIPFIPFIPVEMHFMFWPDILIT
jgi:hypothetical protein